MSEPGTLLLVLALPFAVAGVVAMMAMAVALHSRGERINWLFLRLFMPKYIARYRAVTIQETGHAGALFHVFVISMNLALVLTILGIVLR
jgi:hypothetical protein